MASYKYFEPSFLVLTLLFSLFLVPMVSSDILYYSQTLDHESYGTNLSTIKFNQRYFIDQTFWSGAKAGGPMFVMFGGESSINILLSSPNFMTKIAKQFKGLYVVIEHRFYGNSVPYGSIDLALSDSDVRGCLTISQALEDFAEIISHVKTNISAIHSPVIVMGGSYSGILAALFRLKYTDIAIGAYASSSPIFYLENYTSKYNYYDIVTRDFKDISFPCFDNIKKSWPMIRKMATELGGLDNLSSLFNTCSPLLSVDTIEDLMKNVYTFAAQYNGRYDYWINSICNAITDSVNKNILEGIARAAFAAYPGKPCIDTSSLGIDDVTHLEPNALKAWTFQQCAEVLIPVNIGNDTMFEAQTFNISNHLADCQLLYGGSLQPRWMKPYEQNLDINSILASGSNIIFTNGLKDPHSGAGVLEDINHFVVAITTKKGSHCLDLFEPQPDDPPWLVTQRNRVTNIFTKWFKDHRHHSSCPTVPQPLIIHLLLLLTLL